MWWCRQSGSTCQGSEVGPLSPRILPDTQADKLRGEGSGDMEQRAKPQGSRDLSGWA